MATLVPIPKLGQSEETVTIVNWLVKEGDPIKKGDILFEVETDKAVLEVESQFEGILLKIVTGEDEEVPVMSTACVLGEAGEEIPEIPKIEIKPEPKAQKTPAPKKTEKTKKTVAESAKIPSQKIEIPKDISSEPQRKFVSPRAKKFSENLLINLNDVTPTGVNNRVVEQDVKDYLTRIGYDGIKITPTAKEKALLEKLSLAEIEATGIGGRIVLNDVFTAMKERPQEMTKMRKIIASRLQQSKQIIPHFYVTASIDMTELLALRKKLKKSGFALSVNDFIIMASAMSLKEHPAVNSVSDGSSVKWNSHVNIGVAVNLDAGLVVPVIRDADKMAMDELHAVVRETVSAARDGKLSPDGMKGGTFTISNMGMMNVENFAAIINPGEGAILAVSSAIPTPVADDNRKVVVRDIMKVTVSADHRTIDGVKAAFFVNSIKKKLEDLAYWDNLLDGLL
ncbi:MAG: dihydrolipoamide acetyltransferase family protein [Verrucomicrobiota bacterium]|nr:dihydrolipoamide acetyltransferase family protein [Verrucomicrobiota bacterium]